MNHNPYASPDESQTPAGGKPPVIGDSHVGEQTTFLGHPSGLFVLFFAEMWERFSYYGMRALLVFYMIKGFLGYGDDQAYGVYGAYTALVYMTPFIGGMIADRLLGPRITVVIGGVLMAAGHLMMTLEYNLAFYSALALLIAGNGFFKPNISTMVGSLYPADSPKRDGGFTIFYVGINLGAAMSPLLCGYIGETYDWHYGFGLATIGMLIGLAVFVMPTLITQLLIMSGAVLTAVALFWFHPENIYTTLINVFVGLSLLVGGLMAVMALSRGGLPDEAGRAHSGANPRRNLPKVLIGTAIALPIFVLLVSGFSMFNGGKAVVLISDEVIQGLGTSQLAGVIGTFLQEISKPAGLVLFGTGILAFGFLVFQTFLLDKIARERMFVVLILTFFSMLFWAFFEQAGSSVNNFTDRNVDRVLEHRLVEASEVGTTIQIEPTQEQLGYFNGADLFTLTQLDKLRAENTTQDFAISWTVVESNIGMGIADRNDEIPATVFQAANPVFILIFGLVFTALWTILGRMKLEPSTPIKFAMGLIQLGLGFAIFWLGAKYSTDRGMVFVGYLLFGYLLHTTGELCLSPVGLSMITKLSPKVLVSTVMGGWFLATAFSQLLAAIIALFTGVGHGESGEQTIPAPIDTVNVYGDVFYIIALWAIGSGIVCLVMSPVLKYWMHTKELGTPEGKGKPKPA